MAYDSTSGCVDLTLSSAADLSSAQYHFVKLTADTTINLCTGATDVPVGVLQNKPSAAGRAAVVRCAGVSKLKFSASLAAGTIVACKATTGDAQAAVGTQHVAGQVVEDGGAANQIGTALISCLAPSIKA